MHHHGESAVASFLDELVVHEMVLSIVDEGIYRSLVGDVDEGVSLFEPPCDEVADGLIVALDDVVEVVTKSDGGARASSQDLPAARANRKQKRAAPKGSEK